mmetsp:Transcript_15054/g.45566  ORF Transcript_15054/g.45566 Transcript_15054/m.45566 type:complete len:234 (-) Transcript_15054:1083-1784(-)
MTEKNIMFMMRKKPRFKEEGARRERMRRTRESSGRHLLDGRTDVGKKRSRSKRNPATKEEDLGVDGDEGQQAFDRGESESLEHEARGVAAVALGVADGVREAADAVEARQDEGRQRKDLRGHVEPGDEAAVRFDHVMHGAVGAIVFADRTLVLQQNVLPVRGLENERVGARVARVESGPTVFILERHHVQENDRAAQNHSGRVAPATVADRVELFGVGRVGAEVVNSGRDAVS